jgi:outer membrane protein TolC
MLLIRKLLGVSLLITAVSTAVPQDNGQLVNLDQLIEEALTQNPGVKSAERRWRAAAEQPSQVSTLPDPMIGFNRYGSSVETRVGPMENAFVLSQQIPFPGKLGLKGKMAGQDAAVLYQSYEAEKRDVVFQVRQAYFDLYWVDKSLVILDEYLSLLRDFTQVAEQKYATGQGIQANVLKSQVEISSTIERRLSFEKMRQGVEARLIALLDRPQDSEVGVVTQIDTNRPAFDEQESVRLALAEREELKAIQSMIGKGEFMKGLAKKNYLPDFSLQANYIDIPAGSSPAPDAGKNAWSFTVGLNLPIWLGKRNAAVREAEATISTHTLAYENLENKVRAEIRDVSYRLELSDRTLDLYEQGLLAQAESSLQSALASYRTGKLDFLNLLDAERMLLSLNLGYVKEQASYQKQIAELERAAGGELPGSVN